MTDLRHRVDPRDVPAAKAARRIGLTLAQFEVVLPKLLERGFPEADPTTELYDLKAINQWCDRRHPGIFLQTSPGARHAKSVVKDRLGIGGNG